MTLNHHTIWSIHKFFPLNRIKLIQLQYLSCYIIIGIAAGKSSHSIVTYLDVFYFFNGNFWLIFLYLICNQYQWNDSVKEEFFTFCGHRLRCCYCSWCCAIVFVLVSVFPVHAYLSSLNRDYVNNTTTYVIHERIANDTNMWTVFYTVNLRWESVSLRVWSHARARILLQCKRHWLKVQTLTNRSYVIVSVTVASWINHLWLKWINTITKSKLDRSTDRPIDWGREKK